MKKLRDLKSPQTLTDEEKSSIVKMQHKNSVF